VALGNPSSHGSKAVVLHWPPVALALAHVSLFCKEKERPTGTYPNQ